MKRAEWNGDLSDAIKGADLVAKRKAFRNHLPYAVLRHGEVVLVFPDNHTELATPELLEKLQLNRI